MKKAVLLLSILVLFTGFTAAEVEWSLQTSSTLEYPEANDPTVVCDPGDLASNVGNCPNEATSAIKVGNCISGNAKTLRTDMDSDSINEVRYFPQDTIYNKEDILKCGLMDGKEVSVVSNDNTYVGGTLTVNPLNMNPHKGKYMYIKANFEWSPDKDRHLYRLMFSDDKWDIVEDANLIEMSFYEQGDLLVEEVDGWSSDKCLAHYENNIGGYGVNLDEFDGNTQDSSLYTIDSQDKDGSCITDDEDGDPSDLMQQGFADDYLNELETFNNPDSATPVQDETGRFQPDGEIARAQDPDVEGNSELNGQGPYWYICREGNIGPSDTGKVIDIQPDNSGGLYKCDTTWDNDYDWMDEAVKQDDVSLSDLGKGKWVPVTQCMDDLDNDGEQGVDLDDSGCENNVLTTSEAGGGANKGDTDSGTAECEPRVGIAESYPDGETSYDGEKGAFYDVETNGDFSPEDSDCTYNEFKRHPEHGENPEQFECEWSSYGAGVSSYSGPTLEKAREFCQNRYYSNGESFAQAPMPAVQYFVPREVIPTGPDWANSDGYGNAWDGAYGFQTLHQAENKYTPHENVGPHDSYPWSDKQMENIDGYYDDNYPVVDAWDVANAGGMDNEDVVYPEYGGTLKDEDVFGGGFHGECSTGMNWVSTPDGWRCDIGSYELEELVVSGYRLDSGSTAGKLAGFQINWSEMKNWTEAHPATPPDGSGSYSNAVNVEAMCWQGSQDERPVSLGNVENMSATVQDGEDTYVVGTLPENPDAPDSKSYSCVFGMTQEVWNTDYITGETTLFENGEETNTGYITEGTNNRDKGRITTDSETIRPVDHNPDVESMQTWLQDKEEQTNTVSQVFTHFRKSKSVDRENRDPWINCVNKGRCAIAGN